MARRPSAAAIDCFLSASRDLPLSYGPPGILSGDGPDRRIDEETVIIGRGRPAFDRARAALAAWRQFEVGWIEVFPQGASATPGSVVAVLIRHLGFWSLNGCRVVYSVGDTGGEDRFGFAYGTLPNHAEGGEELFEVTLDSRTSEVLYRIRATSWPQTTLALIGQPVVRLLQARFRRDSGAAMKRAVASVDNQSRGMPNSRA